MRSHEISWPPQFAAVPPGMNEPVHIKSTVKESVLYYIFVFHSPLLKNER